jgi:hypothetical protein
MAKRVKEDKHETGLVKVVDPLVDSPVEADSQHDAPATIGSRAGPSFGLRVRRFFDVLIRLVSWVIILGVIGLGLYYGLPLLYQRFVVPLDQNTAEVTELQSRQGQTEQELADLQSRLETMENEQSQTAKSLTELDQRLSEIETEINARTQSLAALEEIQSELLEQNEAVSAELERQINLLKAMELLSRARLLMYQSNFGLARQDVQIARDVLADVQPQAPASLADDLDEVVRRLDLTLFNLPDFPVAARDDLDIAWQVLLAGLPQGTTSFDATPVPSSTLFSAPDVTVTPTPQGTLQPTSTP